jgi:hypothetical protein
LSSWRCAPAGSDLSSSRTALRAGWIGFEFVQDGAARRLDY